MTLTVSRVLYKYKHVVLELMWPSRSALIFFPLQKCKYQKVLDKLWLILSNPESMAWVLLIASFCENKYNSMAQREKNCWYDTVPFSLSSQHSQFAKKCACPLSFDNTSRVLHAMLASVRGSNRLNEVE